MCGNASTGLAILRILSCTVKHVTRVAPETDQFLNRGHPCNPLTQVIDIDILGPLPETNTGNKYVAVVVYMYTKWPKAYALPNQEADTVAQAVMDNFECRFSCILGVLSDQGRNYESQLFRGLCDRILSPSYKGQLLIILSVMGVWNCSSVRLPVLFSRLQKNKRNGINIFLKSG